MKLETVSLFERIGGMKAVEAAVEIFYAKVIADDRIAHFFRWVNIDAQIAKQKAFLAYAFGAPVNYSGKAMRHAHAHLVDKGLNGTHFDIVLDHLSDTLRELQVAQHLIEEVQHIAAATRSDVLNLD